MNCVPANVAAHQCRTLDGLDGPGAPRLPKQEMVDLRADVLAQIEELSTLVGDLVDLSRGDAGEVVHEPVDMADVVDRSLSGSGGGATISFSTSR